MKALILNSGIGSRLGSLKTCKCLVKLADGVAILDAQILALYRCGIRDIYITTGPYAELLENYMRERYLQEKHPNICFTFIHNPLYNSTNYIYSMHLAREYLHGSEVLLLHGDLFFSQDILQDVISAGSSVMVVDSTKPLPEKDFKAIVKDRRIFSVGVEFFDGAMYAQPLYKLMQKDWDIWLGRIDFFCEQGKTNIYAEDAFNEISDKMDVLPLDITGRVCFEIDTDEDLAMAQESYALVPDRLQTVYSGYGSLENVKRALEETGANKPFVVTRAIKETAQELFGSDAVYFSGYKANPDVKDADVGKALFEREGCDFIVSLGGGSAMDTAKCIIKDSPHIQHLAIPTSAGTGSESTEIAVMYRDNVKQSISDPQIMPSYAILDPTLLKTLPEYHKKSSLLDALCQAIESLWSKGKTAMSVAYARAALRIIWEDARDYLAEDIGFSVNEKHSKNAFRLMNTKCSKNALHSLRILHAANLAGIAINISRTTAPHAMSYKLSTGFGIAHGHAVALCMLPVWEHLLETGSAPQELSRTQYEAFAVLFDSMKLLVDFSTYEGDIKRLPRDLAASVDTLRLGNHPVALAENELIDMYKMIVFKYGGSE